MQVAGFALLQLAVLGLLQPSGHSGHSDVDVLSPLTSQVGRVAGVDTSITFSNTGQHQFVALLVDPAMGGQSDSCVLPPHTGLWQTLGGRQVTRSLAARCKHPWLK